MPPRVNTRYQYCRAFKDNDETWFLEVPDPFIFSNENDSVTYTVQQGDTLSVIAYRFYRKFRNAPQLWRAIAEFNDIIDGTQPLVEGKILTIPSARWIREVFLAPPDSYRFLIMNLGRV